MRYKPRGWLHFQSSTAASSSIHDARLKKVLNLPSNSEYCWLHQYLFFLFCYSKGKVLLVFYKFSFSFFSHPCFTVVKHHSNLSWTILGKYGKFSIFLTSLSFIIILCKAYTTIFNNTLSCYLVFWKHIKYIKHFLSNWSRVAPRFSIWLNL